MGHQTAGMKSQITTGILMLIIGGLAGFGWSQMTVAKEVTEKLMKVQEGWNGQFANIRQTVDQNTIKIDNLKDCDTRQVAAINSLHPIIEAAVQQNTLLLAWLKQYPMTSPAFSNKQ
jgi:hypothetical protein